MTDPSDQNEKELDSGVTPDSDDLGDWEPLDEAPEPPAEPPVAPAPPPFAPPTEYGKAGAVKPADESYGDWMVKKKTLSPRHRRLAQLLASGMKPGDAAKELNYTRARVSVLKTNTQVMQEVDRIQGLVYEDSVKKRLKDSGGSAMDVIESVLRNVSGEVKEETKIQTARWLIEKLDGKPLQQHEVSGGILVGLLDRLDVMKRSGQVIDVTPNGEDETQEERTPRGALSAGPTEELKERTERDRLGDWVTDFTEIEET